MRWVYEDSATQFAHFDQDNNEFVTRDEVKKIKYIVDDTNQHAVFKKKQDMRRFAAADSNKDGYLNSDEFCMYLHPESYTEMNEILAFELIESLDKDGDSLINFDEYLKYIPVPEPIPDEKPSDENVRVVPMSDEDFDDEEENRNDFEQERIFHGTYML